MNRILSLLLCALLLCGCSPQPAPVPTESPSEPPSEPSTPVSVSKTEQEDTLQSFSLNISDAAKLFSMGKQLLILSGTENTTLTLLSGGSLTPSASVTLSFQLGPEDPSLRLGEGQLSYFDPVLRQTVVLDSALREVSHIPAPEGLQGVPILSGDRNTLYYCTSRGVFGWDLEAGLHRQIREMDFPGQSLRDLSLDDKVLSCTIPENGSHRTMLLSSRTGGLLWEEAGDISLSGQEGWYCASLPMGLGQRLLWGKEQEDPQLFLPEDPGSTCFFLTHHAGAVTHGNRGENRLYYYDLQSGRCTASLILSGNLTPISVSDTPEGRLYLLARNEVTGSSTLLHWNVFGDTPSAAPEETSYLFPYLANPDPAALSQCRDYASRLGSQYGIRIFVGEDAARIQPWDFHLEPETQPGILLRELQNLEERLSQFPGALLFDTASHFTSLNLCILRSITGTAESGNQEPEIGVQFLDGTDAYVAITAGKYSEQAFYRELFHVMETHILTESNALDSWNRLNPQEASYTYGDSDTAEALSSWLTGENQAFLDADSMAFPKEDRARIFEAALLPGNKETFRPWILQRKLTAVCQGIRDAYGLTKNPETFPWEQYLDASLAYRK